MARLQIGELRRATEELRTELYQLRERPGEGPVRRSMYENGPDGYRPHY